jgi:putative flippase GtrA
VLSGASFALNFGITVGLHQVLGAPEEAAFAVALVTVFVMNFLGMRYFVYPGEHRSVGKQLMLFAVSSGSFRGLEYLAFLALHTWLHYPYRLVLVVVLGTSFVAKYCYYKVFVFALNRPDLSSADTARFPGNLSAPLVRPSGVGR